MQREGVRLDKTPSFTRIQRSKRAFIPLCDVEGKMLFQHPAEKRQSFSLTLKN
jgi:hypothetical protein